MSPARVAPPPPATLRRWLERFDGLKVVVWGDFVCDEYWFCRSSRLSREAPVPILEYESREHRPGGAGNAALNLAALGARVAVVGWRGLDEAGERLAESLSVRSIDTSGLVARAGAETIVKTRIVAGAEHAARQQVVRIDRGGPFARAARSSRATVEALARATVGTHAVVLSDYGYDSVVPALANRLIPAWRARGLTVALDSRFRLADYRRASVATPNESEAAAAAGLTVRDEAALAAVAGRLRRRTRVDQLLITRGRDGLTLWEARRAASLEAWGGEAVDVTGAGDAVVAAMTLALAAGAPPLAAAALANVAGSVAVSRRGAVAVTRAELGRALRAGGART